MILKTKKKIQRAFTLLELLVAVTLMVVITGAIVIVFQNSTRIFNLSEASINIFQNARAAFDIMGKELAAARNDGADLITITPTSADPDQTLLTFRTLTDFQDATNNQITDFAQVTYRVVQINNTPRWRLIRRFDNPSTGLQANDILCQFITQDNGGNPHISFQLGLFDAATNQWDLTPTQNANANAVRIIMNMTDAQGRIERTVSRVFWVAN